MTKKPYRGGKSKRPKVPGAGGLLAQMQEMQQQMAAQQETLADEALTVTVGGGAVSVTISGHQRVQSITLLPELLDPQEVEMLQDLLVSAVNAAIEQSQALAAERMEKLTGGLGLNDLLGGLGSR